MTSQSPAFLLSTVLLCVLAAQGNPVRAQEDMVSDTDEIEVSTEPSSDEMPDSDDELADEVIESEGDWLEDGKDYAARKANEMTQWVDNFFGNDERDLEQAESRLRLRTIFNWDEGLDNEIKFRLSGKVSLPQISKRLDLVFRGEDMDDISDDGVKDPSEDRVGLQLQVGPKDIKKYRFDLAVGFGSSGPKPGAKFVYQDAFAKDLNFRFTQRFAYDVGEGGYGSSRFVLDKALGDREVVRAYNRFLYGEETDGTEWFSSLSYARGWRADNGRLGATWLYVGADGQTEPYDFVRSYKVGARFRRQAYRDFLFWEVEPSYNWRIDEPYFDREGAWRIELRMEFLLFDNPGETLEKQIR